MQVKHVNGKIVLVDCHPVMRTVDNSPLPVADCYLLEADAMLLLGIKENGSHPIHVDRTPLYQALLEARSFNREDKMKTIQKLKQQIAALESSL